MNWKRTGLLWLLALSICFAAQAAPLTSHPDTSVYDGWRIGPQAYTFNRFTLFEAIDKAQSLGVSWMEIYPGQRLSKDDNTRFDHNASQEIRDRVKEKLASCGIRLASYGVVGLGSDEAANRRVFEFAKDMGIDTIASEPDQRALPLIDRLCQEYEISVALHNHPKPTRYWDPDIVLEACEGRSQWIGACADTGHWMRSDINPLEAVKKFQEAGRLKYFHFKDLNRFGSGAHDVPWGTGQANVKEILHYLHDSGFKGYFSVEYEHNWDNSLPEVQQCVNYFNAIASQLKPTGWKNLLADDLNNCVFREGSWEYEDGVLTRKGGGDIWTKDKYGDFILDLQYRVEEGGNSGVFIRTADLSNWINTAIEVQIHDSTDGTKHGQCGAIYDVLSPSKDMTKPAWEWNHMSIKALGPKIYVVLNGEQIIDMNLDEWTEAGKNPQGTKNKFTIAYKDMARRGFFGFQDHNDEVQFRNIKVKDLSR